jgi:hypothetical protein
VEGKSSAWGVCGNINPSNPLRPIRDVEWLKKSFREFRSEWAIAFTNYHKSGNQDSEDMFLEFSNFCQGNVILMYAFSLFDGEERLLDLLGKSLKEEYLTDTGVDNENDNSHLPKLPVRKFLKKTIFLQMWFRWLRIIHVRYS